MFFRGQIQSVTPCIRVLSKTGTLSYTVYTCNFQLGAISYAVYSCIFEGRYNQLHSVHVFFRRPVQSTTPCTRVISGTGTVSFTVYTRICKADTTSHTTTIYTCILGGRCTQYKYVKSTLYTNLGTRVPVHHYHHDYRLSTAQVLCSSSLRVRGMAKKLALPLSPVSPILTESEIDASIGNCHFSILIFDIRITKIKIRNLSGSILFSLFSALPIWPSPPAAKQNHTNMQ